MMNTTRIDARRHDLDALRASAMLLGIVYHASLSFALGDAWMVRDVSQSKALFVFQDFVHGFRMQLFMLASGFFTAMRWRQEGLKALLWHRCRRVLLPCLLGLITVVPAMNWASGYATKSGADRRAREAMAEPASANIWAAIRHGDAKAMEQHLQSAGTLTNQHPVYGFSPLTWATLTGQRELVQALLDHGADVNSRSREGHTPLHGASFLGRTEIVELLIRKGADVNAASASGEVPLVSAAQPWETVQYIAGIFSIPVDQNTLQAGRENVLAQLKAKGATKAGAAIAGSSGSTLLGPSKLWETYEGLINTPVFILVWFLWFLVWLVALFAVYAFVAERFGWRGLSLDVLVSPWTLVGLIALAILPAWFMGFGHGEFGPDTSMGIIPMPWVLAYYAVFFFFGAFYCESNDSEGRLGRSWRWLLPVTSLVVFPVALEFATSAFGFRDRLPTSLHKGLSVAFQAMYAWMMSFAWMGMFRSLLTRESKTVRYLSDSAYWLYLAHLPLCIAAQTVIAEWPMPAMLKVTLLSVALMAILLLSYHTLVRYTWLGRMLNGPRKRPDKKRSVDALAEGAAT